MRWLVLGSLILANVLKQPTPVVKVSNGLVRGRVSDDGSHYKYVGIPYAAVGPENRFQAPLPAPKWTGVFDAIDEYKRCPQRLIFNFLVVGDVDCLVLNIYTPAMTTDSPYPVMVFLHGGAFLEGSSSSMLYGGEFIVNRGVIIISINYRLSVEGFLCLGIKEAPGNAGLKDQIAALKWIRANIAPFGGDPDNITLFGESAGATSVSHLINSPAAQGLFHKAILQSGSSLVPWGIQHDPIQTARDLAQEFGYYGHDPYEIYNILSNKSVSELILNIKYSKNRNFVTAPILFVPCVENKIPGVEAVITEHPENVMKKGNYTKIPTIRGYNNKEGIYLVGMDYGTTVKTINLYDLLQGDLLFPCEETKNSTAKGIVKQYFSKNNEELVVNLIDLYSDLYIKFPIILESELRARNNDDPMYFYVFTYSGLVNMAKFISKFLFYGGASHADELFYIFKLHVSFVPLQYLEARMIKKMVTLWTNFAKYGDPTPTTSDVLPVKWRPSRATNPTALIVDRELTMAPMWGEAKVHFWNKTYTKYRRRRYSFFNNISVVPALPKFFTHVSRDKVFNL